MTTTEMDPLMMMAGGGSENFEALSLDRLLKQTHSDGMSEKSEETSDSAGTDERVTLHESNMVRLANALLSFSNPASPVSAALHLVTQPINPSGQQRGKYIARHLSKTPFTTAMAPSPTTSSSSASSGSRSASPPSALSMPAEGPAGRYEKAGEGEQFTRNEKGEIRAFAKLQGRNWSYYIQKVSVLLGRGPEGSSTAVTGGGDASALDLCIGEGEGISRKHLRIDYAGPYGWEMYCFGKDGVTVDGKHYEAFCSPILLTGRTKISVAGVDFYFLLPLSAGPPSSFSKGSQHHQSEAKRPKTDPSDNAAAVVDPESVAKPVASYACLIAEAINSSPEARLTLADIYKYLMEKYPYFQHTKSGWQNSIRHNLSLNRAFRKVPREPGEPGKGMFWVIDQEHRHLVEGKPYQRRQSASNTRRVSQGQAISDRLPSLREKLMGLPGGYQFGLLPQHQQQQQQIFAQQRLPHQQFQRMAMAPHGLRSSASFAVPASYGEQPQTVAPHRSGSTMGSLPQRSLAYQSQLIDVIDDGHGEDGSNDLPTRPSPTHSVENMLLAAAEALEAQDDFDDGGGRDSDAPEGKKGDTTTHHPKPNRSTSLPALGQN